MTDMCKMIERRYKTWHHALGDVEFIWSDGYTLTKPIGCTICGITRHMADGTVERYVNYKLNLDKEEAKRMDLVEHAMFTQWLSNVIDGLDKKTSRGRVIKLFLDAQKVLMINGELTYEVTK